MAEQALVEEFRGVQAVQDRQALGHDGAQVFQFLGAELLLAGVQQQGDGHVEALQRLGDGAGQHGEQDELPRARRRADIEVVVAVQQAVRDQRVQPLVDHRVQLFQVPADEQFRLQVGIQRAGVVQ
ncbi:hypothetical protein D9M71_487040 [compost metagenome]